VRRERAGLYESMKEAPDLERLVSVVVYPKRTPDL
jgi:hypothetical protein